MKARKPRFLTPRRKYQVDESMWLVKFGRPKVEMLMRQGQKVVLFVQWRRMPKSWELSFVTKMKIIEAEGITFREVLKTHLPTLFGEAPTEVLLRWIGKRARTQPKRFVKTVADMFGNSAKAIITGLESLADPDEMLEAHKPEEPPFQSLIEAIQQADADQAALTTASADV
jgi:hypothetical protein